MCQDEGDTLRENRYRAALASYTTHAMKGTVQGVLFDSFEKVSAVVSVDVRGMQSTHNHQLYINSDTIRQLLGLGSVNTVKRAFNPGALNKLGDRSSDIRGAAPERSVQTSGLGWRGATTRTQ